MTDYDFGPLNSATKYPSIPTYHSLNPANGNLLEERAPFTGPVILTEKIDGANGRIVILPDGDWLIGSREELLYARGDRIVNPALSIVPTLLPVAEALGDNWPGQDAAICTFYLEVYGYRIGQGAKQYASTDVTSCRLFDMTATPLAVLGWPRDKIASWREHNGQQFLSEDELDAVATREKIRLTPRLGTVDAAGLPFSLEATLAFLSLRLPVSQSALDEGAGHHGEGIVLRTPGREVIAKARFADYERTLKRPDKKKS
jgi:hypothetical protein